MKQTWLNCVISSGSNAASSSDTISAPVSPTSHSPSQSPAPIKEIEEKPEAVENSEHLNHQDPPQSLDETTECSQSKSFYSSSELDSALSALPVDKIDYARYRCSQLRYPPLLAVLMEQEKVLYKEPSNNSQTSDKLFPRVEIHASRCGDNLSSRKAYTASDVTARSSKSRVPRKLSARRALKFQSEDVCEASDQLVSGKSLCGTI